MCFFSSHVIAFWGCSEQSRVPKRLSRPLGGKNFCGQKYILLPTRVGPMLPAGSAGTNVCMLLFLLVLYDKSGLSVRSIFSTSVSGMEARNICRMCCRDFSLIRLNFGAKLPVEWRLPLFLLDAWLFMATDFVGSKLGSRNGRNWVLLGSTVK